MKLKRAEIWTDVEGSAGTLVGVIPPADLFDVRVDQNVREGSVKTTMKLARDSVIFPDIVERRAIQLHMDDGDVVESRIIKPAQTRVADGSRLASIVGTTVMEDLANGIISRTEADGRISLEYTLRGQTRAQLLAHILTAVPSHFSAGIVTNSSKVVPTFTFKFDEPLTALQELASMEGLELSIRRQGAFVRVGRDQFNDTDQLAIASHTPDLLFGAWDNGPGTGGANPPKIQAQFGGSECVNAALTGFDRSFLGDRTGIRDNFVYEVLVRRAGTTGTERGGLIYRSDDNGSGASSPMFTDGDYQQLQIRGDTGGVTGDIRHSTFTGGFGGAPSISGTFPWVANQQVLLGVEIIGSTAICYIETTPHDFATRQVLLILDLSAGGDFNDSAHDAFGCHLHDSGIVASLEDLELFTPGGSVGYRVDILQTTGFGAPVPDFRFRKNLLSLERTVDASKLKNRLFPSGAELGGVTMSVQDTLWEVGTAPTTLQIDLPPEDELIGADDHLNGKWIERLSDGVHIQIDDTDVALQRLIFLSAHGLTAGGLFYIRTNGTSGRLAYVEDEVSTAAHGIVTGKYSQTDIPAVANIVANPDLNGAYASGVPVGWSAVASATLAENTNAQFTRVGGKSVRVTGGIGDGIRSDTITLTPAAPDIFFSAFTQLYLDAGSVVMYLDHSTEGRFPLEGAKKEAIAQTVDRWFDNLGVEGRELPPGTVRIVILAREASTDFYLDAAQLTMTPAHRPYFPGHSGRTLWARALEQLREFSTPLVTYEISGHDLHAADAANYPFDKLTIGGDVFVNDPELNLAVQTRVLKLSHDVLRGWPVKLTLSNEREDLIEGLVGLRRRELIPPPVPPEQTRIASFKADHDTDGTIVLKFLGEGATRSFRYSIGIGSLPTYASTLSSGTIQNTVDGSEITTTTLLTRSQRAFVRVIAFPRLSAGGQPGESATDQTGPPSFWGATIESTVVNETGTSPNISVTRGWTVDQRAHKIRVYRRTHATLWPTKDGTQTGELDPTFQVAEVDAHDNWEFIGPTTSTTADDIQDIAVAFGTNGEEGDRQENSYTVIGTAGPQFGVWMRTEDQSGTGCGSGTQREITVDWDTTGAADVTHEVRIYEKIGSNPWGSPVFTETSPVTTLSYTHVSSQWSHATGIPVDTEMKIELWLTSGPTLQDTKVLSETLPGQTWVQC